MKPALRTLFVLTAIAIAVRLFAMTFLHPLNWDEVEYFRATDWVRQGLVPFRDFWEHHTPLQWFVFAPFTALTDSPGAAAIIFMRWMQVPLWIAAFWLINRLMQRMELDAFARWSAITLAATSSLLMLSAVEYRVDALANVLYLGGLVLRGEGSEKPLTRPSATLSPHAGRGATMLTAGALLTLTVFANLRLAPLVAVTVLLCRSWRVAAGAVITGLAGLMYFVATDSLQALYQHAWLDNYIGEKLAERVPYAFLHRLLVPFGLGIYGGASGIVDLAGAAVIVLGVFGLARHWRGPLFILAILQIVNILFLIRMKFVYHYHLQIAVLLMLPFVAAAIQHLPWRRSMMALIVIAAIVMVPIVLLRGKEFDLRYQDRIMREVHAHTAPGAKVFDGVGWAIRRQPAYRFWFLPVLARQLVASGEAPPYALRDWIADPPAAVITDRNAKVWLAMNPDLRSYVEHHYLPLWRDLWLPGLHARLNAGGQRNWIVPADGRYRIVAGADVSRGPQFRATPRGAQLLEWKVNGVPVAPQDVLELRRGSRVTATASTALSVFLVPGDETVWFREPPPGVTIDAELPRVWHVPFSAPIPTSSARP